MSKKVALVENNLILSSRIVASLKALGYEVKTVQRWKSLSELLGEFSPDIVMINLEGIEGVEVLKKLREMDSQIPVVAYCGHKNIQLQEEARNLGANLVVPNSAVATQLSEVLSMLSSTF